MIVAARHPELVDAFALICPGTSSHGSAFPRRERLEIAWAFLTNRRKTFPIPLSDPALFTASSGGPGIHRRRPAQPPRRRRPGCWPPASSSIGWSREHPPGSTSLPC